MSNRWRPFKLKFSAILLPTFWTNRIPCNIYVSLPIRVTSLGRVRSNSLTQQLAQLLYIRSTRSSAIKWNCIPAPVWRQTFNLSSKLLLQAHVPRETHLWSMIGLLVCNYLLASSASTTSWLYIHCPEKAHYTFSYYWSWLVCERIIERLVLKKWVPMRLPAFLIVVGACMRACVNACVWRKI